MKKGIVPLAVGMIVVSGLAGCSLGKGGGDDASKVQSTTVQRGELKVSVVENGKVDSVKSVEVKSRVTGRLARLLVDEGDVVQQGQLIAVIDPQETVLRVQQDAAQLAGAQSGAERARLEIAQRRVTSQATFAQAQSRVKQLELELKTQPILNRSAISEAQSALATAEQEKIRLVQSSIPGLRVQNQSSVREAKASVEVADLEYRRQRDLLQQGYTAARSLEQAKVSLEQAQARLATAEENVRVQEAQFRVQVSQADEAIRQARAGLQRANANQVQVELKRQELATAQSELSKAKASLSDPAILEQGRAQSLATVDQLSSILSDSRRQLGETEIRAPISGIVTSKGLQVGELVTGLSTFGSGTTIVKIEDRTKMRVMLNVNEIDTAKLQKGMTAKIDVDAIPGKSYQGNVIKIAPASVQAAPGQAATDAVVRYAVEIQVLDTDARLRTGMSAKCTLNVIDKKGVLTVPRSYVQSKEGKAYVFTPNPSKEPKAKPIEKEVKVGDESGSQIEILSGITEGEKLVMPPFDGPDRQGFIQIGRGG